MKKPKHTNKSAVSNETGNSLAQLTQLWRAIASQPKMKGALNKMASELDEILKRRLPDQTFRGPLAGMEAEIRQDAMILLMEKFLLGNIKLHDATNSDDPAEIENQICRSINAALRICEPRIHRRIAKERARQEEGLESEDPKWGTCQHPSGLSFWYLPIESQRIVLMQLIRTGIRQHRLTPEGAALVTEMLEESLSQSALAMAKRISRQVAFYRLRQVRKFLQENLDNVEFPLS